MGALKTWEVWRDEDGKVRGELRSDVRLHEIGIYDVVVGDGEIWTGELPRLRFPPRSTVLSPPAADSLLIGPLFGSQPLPTPPSSSRHSPPPRRQPHLSPLSAFPTPQASNPSCLFTSPSPPSAPPTSSPAPQTSLSGHSTSPLPSWIRTTLPVSTLSRRPLLDLQSRQQLLRRREGGRRGMAFLCL